MITLSDELKAAIKEKCDAEAIYHAHQMMNAYGKTPEETLEMQISYNLACIRYSRASSRVSALVKEHEAAI